MRINTWADEKQLIRDKIKELFRICEETSATGLEMYIKLEPENAPTIEYKVKNTLVKIKRGDRDDAID